MASSTMQSGLLKRESTGKREGDQLIVTPLGAGNEVGRSCVYMTYKGKTVMVCYYKLIIVVYQLCNKILSFTSSVFVWQFDCGIHPAYSGMAALPYFDEIDPANIDVLLITQ